MWITLNRPDAMNSRTNQVELLDPEGRVVVKREGTKEMVATGILQQIRRSLLAPQRSHDERDQTV